MPPFERFEERYWENLGLDVNRGYNQIELLDKRILVLDSELDETTATTLSSFVRLLNLEDQSRPIKLLIDSPGGNAKAALSLYDTIETSKAPVETVCMRKAGSGTCLLLAAGARGYRVGLPHCSMNLTQPDILEPHMSGSRDRMVKIYAQTTGQPESVISKDLESGFFMTAEEAKEYGILDRIVITPE